MEFRWVALLALWTILSGPIFGAPSGPSHAKERRATVAVKVAPHDKNMRRR
jgi:hypothetical protein